jgi:hypothetical protein
MGGIYTRASVGGLGQRIFIQQTIYVQRDETPFNNLFSLFV